MYQKYANSMPLYRQEQDWKQMVVILSRATLADWVIYCAGNYFIPLYDYFHQELLKHQFLIADAALEKLAPWDQEVIAQCSNTVQSNMHASDRME